MAGSSFFALFDDIATILDDVSVMTKVAAKKTAGVLGDDLALNAQQVTGVPVNRELPVVWGVARGSLVNKAILVPVALLISQFAHWLVGPLMMLGGAYLCFEGVEKVLHALLPSANRTRRPRRRQATVHDTFALGASSMKECASSTFAERLGAGCAALRVARQLACDEDASSRDEFSDRRD